MKHFTAPFKLFSILLIFAACNSEKKLQTVAKPSEFQLAGGFTPAKSKSIVFSDETDSVKIADVEKEISVTKNNVNQYRKTSKVSLANPINKPNVKIKKQEVLAQINKSVSDNLTANKVHKTENKATSAGVILGVIFAILGFLILMFASIAFGALIMLVGFILMVVSAATPSPQQPAPVQQQQQQPKQKVMQDVVYLKNGSIIRGLIIEQIIGEQIKIQTKDGSVWVFKNEEIIKIVKELEVD